MKLDTNIYQYNDFVWHPIDGSREKLFLLKLAIRSRSGNQETIYIVQEYLNEYSRRS